MEQLPTRKSPRAYWHEYDGAEYFVTICTHNRAHYFGEVRDGQMQLTDLGGFLRQEIERTITVRKGDVEIPLYVIMPNHVHLIIVINNCRDASNASANRSDASNASDNPTDARRASLQFGPQSNNLGSVIRGIKSSVTHFALQNNITFKWQSRYHDHIVRNREEMNRIAEYIEQNPMKWELDCFYGND